ncbi:MAG: nucleotidyltransferase family protein [Coriobacteriales bacterium]|jgi:CTP:molybdopterin cytidylyltransferase MocA|nr:nucleotidyltransferase family protein [Coriobacteriales bacterium]
MDTVAAIIPVAGLSSRMGSFKPLIKLDGFSLIQRAVQSALAGGVQTVALVTGERANDVKAALADQCGGEQGDRILFVNNPHFETSDMLQSVKLALSGLLEHKEGRPACVFVLPGDMPGVRPQTFAALQTRWRETRAAVLVPCYEGRRGHPVLFSNECFEAVLAADEHSGGLKNALTDHEWLEVHLSDPGILLDADTPQALARLGQHIETTTTRSWRRNHD